MSQDIKSPRVDQKKRDVNKEAVKELFQLRTIEAAVNCKAQHNPNSSAALISPMSYISMC